MDLSVKDVVILFNVSGKAIHRVKNVCGREECCGVFLCSVADIHRGDRG